MSNAHTLLRLTNRLFSNPQMMEASYFDRIASILEARNEGIVELALQNVASSYTYGFSVHEKVYRKRYKGSGSRYNDGLVGWKKLPIRSQDTISGWIFDETGRDLVGVEQDLSLVNNYGRYSSLAAANNGNTITIPRKKFMLFRVNPERDNPEGNSLLKTVYLSWKYRTAIEEQEAIGVVRNMVGTPCVDKIAPL